MQIKVITIILIIISMLLVGCNSTQQKDIDLATRTGLGIPAQTITQKSGFTNDSATLCKLEYDWLMAEFKLDTSTISKMMDDSFISISNTVCSKQEELDGIYENMSQWLKNGHIVDSLYLDDVTIKIHGSTAVVTFISVIKGKIKNVPFSNRRFRMYDVWIKKNGEWKAVSSGQSPPDD